jgi:hypothetical protein
VDVDDAEAQKAQELLQKLGRLGWRQGLGATLWAHAAQDELARHEEARSKFEGGTNREWWERFHSSAYLAIVAVHQVLAIEKQVRSLTGDAELQKARHEFEAQGRDAGAIRDLVVHFDAYAVGKGQRQAPGHRRPVVTGELSPLLFWGEEGRSYVSIGNEQVDLHTIVDEAARLAEVVERVVEKHFLRASERVDAVFRRQYGLPRE